MKFVSRVYYLFFPILFFLIINISSEHGDKSPITDEKYFTKNGFNLAKLSVQKADVKLDNGIFHLALESDLDTSIMIEIYKSAAVKKQATGTVLGNGDKKFVITDYYIAEKKETAFSLTSVYPITIRMRSNYFVNMISEVMLPVYNIL